MFMINHSRSPERLEWCPTIVTSRGVSRKTAHTGARHCLDNKTDASNSSTEKQVGISAIRRESSEEHPRVVVVVIFLMCFTLAGTAAGAAAKPVRRYQETGQQRLLTCTPT